MDTPPERSDQDEHDAYIAALRERIEEEARAASYMYGAAMRGRLEA